MSTAQTRRLPLDRQAIERNEQSPYLRVKIDRSEQHSQFVDYLHRLGCTVDECGAGIFDVRVTHPRTVEDEKAAIAEWCAAWSSVHSAQALITGTTPAGPVNRTRARTAA
jgi:hypothetical protein